MRVTILNVVLLGLFTTESCRGLEQNLRVYGGEEVEVDEIPYIVSIMFRNIYFCGGAILSEDWIITAAHCVVDNSDDLEIYAGFVDMENPTDDMQLSKVEEAFIHPLYGHKKHSITHDVALIKLKTKFNLSEAVAPISIIEEDELEDVINHQESGTISGWGANDMSVLAKFLHSGTVRLESDEDCAKRDTPDCENFQPEAHLCSSLGTEDSPQAVAGVWDDGSPLVVRNKLAGLVLQGKYAQKGKCEYYATTYARLPFYKSFIEVYIPEIFKVQKEVSHIFEAEFVFQHDNETENGVDGIFRNFHMCNFRYWWFDKRDADEEDQDDSMEQKIAGSKQYIINFKLVKTSKFSNDCYGLNVFDMFVITPYVSIKYIE
nr:trypsin-7-like [Leptinotarsa decemlineata]